MISWANYHSHTQYCDGSSEPLSYIREAVKKGLPAYGFSSHAPVNFPADWCMADDKLSTYLQEIHTIKELYNTRIEVFSGLEIDYIPGVAGRSKHILKEIPLDFFIGSVHFVDTFHDNTHWNIDTSNELFQKGLMEIFGNNFQKAATRFYEITRQMIVEDKPDVIGHIDKIKMFNDNGIYFSESEKWYKDQIDMTIQTLKENDIIVEINTRGYYRYGQSDLYPAEWIIRKLAKADIPLMLSSDAHRPQEIISGMPYAAKRLLAIGVKKLVALRSGKWNEYSFSERGIYWS